jgi:membrane-associated phospholipid phosphatase
MTRAASLLVRPVSPRFVAFALGSALVLAAAIVPIDGWIVTHIGPHQGGLASRLGGDVVRELEFLQQFGAVTSMLVAGAIIWLLDPAKKRGVLHLAITLATCGLLGHVLKIFFARPRPRVLFDATPMSGFDTPTHFAFFWRSYPLPRAEGDTTTYLWAHSWELWKGIGSDLASFPSSHAMASACAAACLAHLYPRLSPLLLALAIGVALCRVLLGAHYLSDVVFGSTAGLVYGMWMMQRLGRGGTPSPS